MSSVESKNPGKNFGLFQARNIWGFSKIPIYFWPKNVKKFLPPPKSLGGPALDPPNEKEDANKFGVEEEESPKSVPPPAVVAVPKKFLDFFGADTGREKHLSRAVSAPKNSIYHELYLLGPMRQ